MLFATMRRRDGRNGRWRRRQVQTRHHRRCFGGCGWLGCCCCANRHRGGHGNREHVLEFRFRNFRLVVAVAAIVATGKDDPRRKLRIRCLAVADLVDAVVFCILVVLELWLLWVLLRLIFVRDTTTRRTVGPSAAAAASTSSSSASATLLIVTATSSSSAAATIGAVAACGFGTARSVIIVVVVSSSAAPMIVVWRRLLTAILWILLLLRMRASIIRCCYDRSSRMISAFV